MKTPAHCAGRTSYVTLSITGKRQLQGRKIATTRTCSTLIGHFPALVPDLLST